LRRDPLLVIDDFIVESRQVTPPGVRVLCFLAVDERKSVVIAATPTRPPIRGLHLEEIREIALGVGLVRAKESSLIAYRAGNLASVPHDFRQSRMTSTTSRPMVMAG